MNEFDIYNNIDYAMHRHDVLSIYEDHDFNSVNKDRRYKGYVVLAVIQHADTDTYVHNGAPIYNAGVIYVMGIPRPQRCYGSNCDAPMIWYHEKNEWTSCKECAETKAHSTKMNS